LRLFVRLLVSVIFAENAEGALANLFNFGNLVAKIIRVNS